VIAGVASGGKLVRPWLGAGGQTVTADLAPALGLARPVGVVIGEIYPGGPAERAGLKRREVVTKVDGREVNDSEALRFRIATQKVGATVRLTVLADGRERTVPVALIAPPEDPPRDLTVLRGNHPLVGATVANLSPALVEELGMDMPPRGVVIMEIRRGSPVQRLRLAPGDVLLRLNDKETRSVEDVRRAVGQKAQSWRIVFRRGEQVVNLTVGG
jgi:serine protease Do